ncbi:MAG: hypothetical protein AAGI67_11970 [Pseudomonadota bacterium]
MSKFDGPLHIDLAARASDYLVLSLFSSLTILACFWGDPALAAAAVPPLVALLLVCWTRLREPRWYALRRRSDGGWQALYLDGRWESVDVQSNFRSAAVVLMTIRCRLGRHSRAIWRHHQPDEFRRMLGRIDEGREA